MEALQLFIFKSPGNITYQKKSISVNSDQLIIADKHSVTASTFCCSNLLTVDCYPADLQQIYHMLAPATILDRNFTPLPYKTVPIAAEMTEAAQQLNSSDRMAALRFLYLYCIGTEKTYFTQLLQYFVQDTKLLFDFFEKYSLNSWSVSRYAYELGIPARKLNFLFQGKFGISVKKWLLERRLNKGRELLLSTRLRISDIALECGFSNHAHFSETFRRRYQQCPIKLRTEI